MHVSNPGSLGQERNLRIRWVGLDKARGGRVALLVTNTTPGHTATRGPALLVPPTLHRDTEMEARFEGGSVVRWQHLCVGQGSFCSACLGNPDFRGSSSEKPDHHAVTLLI